MASLWLEKPELSLVHGRDARFTADTSALLPLDFVASQLIKLNQTSPSQARSAYSDILLIPGFESLRISPFFRNVKRSWNTSSPKYPVFWDMEDVLVKLVGQHINCNNVQQVRDRLIICWRLFGMYRTVDLAHL